MVSANFFFFFFFLKPEFWCGNEEGTDQNCERSSFSPQHSHQNIGLLKRGLLILIGLSLCLHSPTSSAAISGFGAGGDVRGASNAGLHSRRTWPSSALSLPTCAFTSEKDWQFASLVPKIFVWPVRWTTQRWRGRAHRIEPLRESSTEAYASEPCECSQCGVKACSDCVRWSPLKCKACRSPQSMSITEAPALQVACRVPFRSFCRFRCPMSHQPTPCFSQSCSRHSHASCVLTVVPININRFVCSELNFSQTCKTPYLY